MRHAPNFAFSAVLVVVASALLPAAPGASQIWSSAPPAASRLWSSAPPATTPPGPTTTTVSRFGLLPSAPSTLPLTTKRQSAHISTVFPVLSVAGFLLALFIVASQLVLTRPGRKGRWTL